MVRYKLLINYTEIGISQIQNTTHRAASFRTEAARMGVTVEDQVWTLGAYDGILTLSSDAEEKIIALTTHLARQGFVRTCLLRAYTESEFAGILARLPGAPIDLE
jgi:uncharacterized protein with GYD domain